MSNVRRAVNSLRHPKLYFVIMRNAIAHFDQIYLLGQSPALLFFCKFIRLLKATSSPVPFSSANHRSSEARVAVGGGGASFIICSPFRWIKEERRVVFIQASVLARLVVAESHSCLPMPSHSQGKKRIRG